MRESESLKWYELGKLMVSGFKDGFTDITYCSNDDCENYDCTRHPTNMPHFKLVSIAQFKDCKYFPSNAEEE